MLTFFFNMPIIISVYIWLFFFFLQFLWCLRTSLKYLQWSRREAGHHLLLSPPCSGMSHHSESLARLPGISALIHVHHTPWRGFHLPWRLFCQFRASPRAGSQVTRTESCKLTWHTFKWVEEPPCLSPRSLRKLPNRKDENLSVFQWEGPRRGAAKMGSGSLENWEKSCCRISGLVIGTPLGPAYFHLCVHVCVWGREGREGVGSGKPGN